MVYKELVDVGLGEEYGIFVAVGGDGGGKVVGLRGVDEGEGGVKGLWDFSESVSSFVQGRVGGGWTWRFVLIMFVFDSNA